MKKNSKTYATKSIFVALTAICLILTMFFSVLPNSTSFSASALTSQKTLILGDADGDGVVSIKDATAIQKHLAKLDTLSEDGLLVADVNGDNSLNIVDATDIQKYLAAFKCDYPIGEPIVFGPEEPSTPDETESTTEETIVVPIPTEPTIKEPTEVTTPTLPTEPTEPVKPTEPVTEPTEKPTEEPTETPTKPSGDTAPPDPIKGDVVTAEHLKKIEAGFLRLVNEERAKHGLSKLTTKKHIDDVAQIRSTEIIDVFSHSRPDGSMYYDLVDYSKYSYTILGENICMTTHVGTNAFNPREDAFIGTEQQIEDAYTWIFTVFKNSPPHYENMLTEEYEHTGIGISYTIDEKWGVPYFYVAHIFGAD